MRIGVQHRRAANLRVGAPDAMPAARRGPCFWSLCGLCGLTLAVVMGPALAQDQDTVVIGGGAGYGATTTYGAGAGGVMVNDEVLDSLGAGATPDLPYSGETDVQSLAVEGLPAGTAYRLPGTSQLVVTRPSTLLFPPLQPPHSHLTVTPPSGALAALPETPGQTVAAEPGKATSQLLIQPEEPPEAMAPSPAPAPQPVVAETLTAPVPEPVPEPMAGMAPAPESTAPSATPAVPEAAPAPAGLTAELQGEPSQAMTAPEPPPQPEAMAPQPETAAVVPPAPEVTTQVEQPAAAATGQSAALPAAPGTAGLQRIGFAQGSADLTEEAKRTLDGIAAQMQSKKSIRAQLLAYAADSGDGGSQARRLSLSRALAVRAYLIDKGVRSTRLDVRALGSKIPDGPPDRVDVIPQSSG